MLAFAARRASPKPRRRPATLTRRARRLAEMERTPLGHKGFAVELELARAWSAAAHGELSRARALARERGGLA